MSHSIIGRICRPSSKAQRLLAVVLPAAALGAAKLDSRLPTTQPVRGPTATQPPQPAGASLPTAFSLLAKRSIFSRNGMAAVPPGTNPGKPEAAIALRGIVYDDSSFVLFVEDTAAHHTMQLRPGDPLAGGKIGQINLDEFGYEAGGTVTHVRVGQNLLGMTLPPVRVTPPATAPSPGGPQGGPPEATPPPNGPIYEIGPNGQRIRNLAKERAG